MSDSEQNHRSSSPRSSIDDIIDIYKKSVDRTLIRENLKLTHHERLMKLQRLQRAVDELHRAGRALRRTT